MVTEDTNNSGADSANGDNDPKPGDSNVPTTGSLSDESASAQTGDSNVPTQS